MTDLEYRSPHPSEEATARLLANAKRLYPSLITPEFPELKLLKVNLGRRPMRKGGLRIEKETIPIEDSVTTESRQKEVMIIHCYGAGGSGYEMSWGATKKVEELILN
jgi:D-amino-acid oxidase